MALGLNHGRQKKRSSQKRELIDIGKVKDMLSRQKYSFNRSLLLSFSLAYVDPLLDVQA